MRAVALHDAAHAHGRGALEESAGHYGIGARDGIAITGNGEDAVVDALDHLADASLDASLIAKVSDVFAALSDDDARLLGRDDGAERELSLGVFLVRLRGGLAVGAEALIHLELIHGIDNVVSVGGENFLRGRHVCCEVGRGSLGAREWKRTGGLLRKYVSVEGKVSGLLGGRQSPASCQ